MADPQVPGWTQIANTTGAFQQTAQAPETIDQFTLGVTPGTYAPVFGVAAPTGVAATDTANIEAQITAASTAGGGTVQLQNGSYQVNSYSRSDASVTFTSSTAIWADTSITSADVGRYVLCGFQNSAYAVETPQIVSVVPGVSFTTDINPGGSLTSQTVMIVSPGFVLPSGVSLQGVGGMITNNFNTSGTAGTAVLDSGTGVTLLIRGGTAATYQPVSNILFKSGPLSSWFTAGTAWAGVYCGNQAWYTAFDHCDFTCYATAGFVTDANFNNITLTNCFFGYNGTLGATAITGGLLVGYFTATASAALNCMSCLFYQNYGVGAGGYVPGSVGAYGVNFFGCQFAGNRATSFATWSGYNLLVVGGGNGNTIVDGCWFEDASVGDLYLYTGPCVAIGCSFNSNGSRSQINNAQATSYLTLLGCFTSVSSGSTIPYMVTNTGGVVNWMGVQMPYSGGTFLASGGPSQAQMASIGTIGGTTYSPSIGINAAAPTVAGTTATTPPTNATIQTALGNLTLGTAYQNTLSYDVVLTVYLSITANTTGVLKLGVGTTNTPTQTTIVTGVTTVGFVPVKFKIPASYYALLSISGTVTDSIVGQYLEAA